MVLTVRSPSSWLACVTEEADAPSSALFDFGVSFGLVFLMAGQELSKSIKRQRARFWEIKADPGSLRGIF